MSVLIPYEYVSMISYLELLNNASLYEIRPLSECRMILPEVRCVCVVTLKLLVAFMNVCMMRIVIDMGVW